MCDINKCILIVSENICKDKVMGEKYVFMEKWDEDVSISWWKTSRIELNKIIEIYNDWQINYDFSKDRAKFVFANIELGKQTIGSTDGGSGYLSNLEEMEQNVKQLMK